MLAKAHIMWEILTWLFFHSGKNGQNSFNQVDLFFFFTNSSHVKYDELRKDEDEAEEDE